jgi:hypothetical protein
MTPGGARDSFHVHDYDGSWRCKCGFVLPERFRPKMTGPVDAPATYVSMDAWRESMREYEGRGGPTLDCGRKLRRFRRPPRLEALV